MLYKNLYLYMFPFDIVKINCIQDVPGTSFKQEVVAQWQKLKTLD